MTPLTASLTSIEPSPEYIIRDLHRIREAMADSYGGDLQALSKDCYRKVIESGWPVWQRPDSVESASANGGLAPAQHLEAVTTDR